MTSFAPLRPETVEDQRRYLEGHLQEVSCLDCLAVVLVRKHSEVHTSIQWHGDASQQCAEFAKARAEGDYQVKRSCGRLKASIERAAHEGQIEIGGGVD